MRAIAFVCTYQEADIIGWTVRHLKRQGLDVLVIDCHSSDGTPEIAKEAGAHILPYSAPPVSWHALLGEVEQLSVKYCQVFRSIDPQRPVYDWCMLSDADEIRYSNNLDDTETLTTAFERVQAGGYNAIDFQLLTFHPTDNGFDGSQDPEQYFRFYSGDPLNQRIGQAKAWRNIGPVSLAASGGHQVQFQGRRVYPSRFLSKHYPIRSQAHGVRKVFQERKWLDPSQGRTDWHVQYKGLKPGHNFLRNPAELMEWE